MDYLADISLFNPESIKLPVQLRPPKGDERIFIIMDIEPSHITPEKGSLIALSMLKAKYSPSAKRVVSIIDSFIAYDEPEEPFDECITEITGITESDLKNQHIDADIIKSWLSGSDFILCHNAEFDRAFFEKRFSNECHHHWVCTLRDLDWSGVPPRRRALTELAERFAWPYEFRGPHSYCVAIAWFLHSEPTKFSPIYLESTRQHG